MQIGPHQLDTAILVAPMAGVTDKPFRQFCRAFGAGLATSEMVSANPALRQSRKSLRRIDFSDESGPISVQILGADPRAMAEAARVNVGHGAEIIDINMGCPAKKVCRTAAGSALMKNERLAALILEAVVKAVEVPVTLKIRTGWDQQHRNGLRIARIAETVGIQAITVHGRTRACGFKGEAEYQTIREIKQNLSIPVIANGDIDTPEKAAEVLQYSGVDAIMVGRAAWGKPWIFREISHYLQTGEKLAPPQPEWIREVVLTHINKLHQFYGEHLGVRIARKHIAWYSNNLSENMRFRKQINNTGTAEKQLDLINSYFDRLPNNKELAA